MDTGRWPCLWQVLFEPTAKASLSSSSGTKDYLVLKVLQDARAQAQRTAEDSTVPPFPSPAVGPIAQARAAWRTNEQAGQGCDERRTINSSLGRLP